MDLSFLLSSKGTSSAASLALSWTFLLVQTVYPSPDKREGATWKKLVEVQSLLLSDVLGGTNKHNLEGIVKKLRQSWKELQSLQVACLTRLLFVPPCAQDKCTPLLRHATHQEFKDLLLPTLLKSLLRSPENITETISSLLSSVTLDMSQYAMDIGKGLASQLKANNPQVMDEAVLALQTLALQCSDPSAVESLGKHLFAILGGIGSLSQHSVSGSSSQALSSTVAELFIPFLQQEGSYSLHSNTVDLQLTGCLPACLASQVIVQRQFTAAAARERIGIHEGTLVHAVSVLTLWSSKFTTEVPTKLVEWLKKAFTLKTSTSAVRHAYLQCLLACFRGDTLLQGVELLPLLIQTVEKASSQTTQIPVITEGVAAAVLLCRLCTVESQLGKL
ncbi:Translational activator GCN1 [Acipenser ruthenus]|uniref:Translational activator GCN1 n=1 Tax=Acipenser ruthenus TaxID=7906 RepID=A0A444UZP0_ACIRT|nr:Translational activator GCN1 [Acipenser ruthenus]